MQKNCQKVNKKKPWGKIKKVKNEIEKNEIEKNNFFPAT